MNKTNKNNFFQSAFWKRFGIGCVLLVIAFGFFVANMIQVNRNQHSALADGNVTISEDELNAIVDNRQQTESLVKNIANVSVSRKESDDRVAASLFKYATTWDSAASYKSSYEALLRNFDYLDENCQLLREFFPPLSKIQITDSSGAIVRDPFESSINMSFVSLDTFVIDVNEETGIYTYFGQVHVQSKGAYGGTAEGIVVALYKTDADGHVLEPTLYMTCA